MIATVLVDVLALVKTGFEFAAIVQEVQALVARGATDKEVSTWISNLRKEALDDLEEATE